MKKHVLIPAVTVAEWGGLHEWVADAVSWLVDAGHRVTVVGAGARFTAAVAAAGADVVPMKDWLAWKGSLPAILAAGEDSPFDLIFTHGPQARAVGLAVAAHTGAPIYVMVHGAYHDYAFEWINRARRILVASPSLADYMTRHAKVPAEMIRVVPNGLPESIRHISIPGLDAKVADGVGHVMTASRLDQDKTRQIPVTLQVLAACVRARPDVRWQLDVYGDGRLRGLFEKELRAGVATIPGASVTFHGWIPPELVPVRMSEAVVGIVAGLGGMRSIATGVLCVAVGARDIVGVQYGENLTQGIYSNFGDHGSQGYVPTPIDADLAFLLESAERYDDVVTSARSVAMEQRSSTVIKEALFRALELEPVPLPHDRLDERPERRIPA